ncbi:hypothetical protein SAMN05660845_0546 [Flavobacterium swingsii]|jgi:phosphatidylglycerophosphatase A|uniref:Uncharacterized protein n=1 Tax=Flavobacterium swingsii TaxID=498292 RepID=A0A1I0VT47_9FLAO|nr:hypothetical protein [Flavobacterium swingsii]SFA78866.1 hypothetical protein SAMN05660845_0546 [Flavobacterium swingsii]
MLNRVESRPELEKRTGEAKSKVERQNRSIMFLLLIAYCLLPIASNAQCAMCRASLESTGNVSQAEAVNDGIVYLMIIPYVLVALIAFAVYRMYRKKK